jgi:hypothetical protein
MEKSTEPFVLRFGLKMAVMESNKIAWKHYRSSYSLSVTFLAAELVPHFRLCAGQRGVRSTAGLQLGILARMLASATYRSQKGSADCLDGQRRATVDKSEVLKT